MTLVRYFRLFFLVLGAGLGLVAAVNWVVDPCASFRWSDIRGFNDMKNLKSFGGRVNKALILTGTPFEVLFFGTSRAEVGLSPASVVLEGRPAFNAALSFTNMVELQRAAAYVADHQSPQLVVIGLDMIAFSSDTAVSGDFAESAFAGKSLLPVYAERLLSRRMLGASFTVVSASLRHRPSSYPKTGTYDPPQSEAESDRGRAFTQVLRQYLGSAGANYRTFRYRPERMALLADMVRRFDAKGARVVLFVSPIHAQLFEAMAAAGLGPTNEQWKRDLVATVAEINRGARTPVRLWDFSGYNSVTTEPLPVSGRMRWYWEPSHYTKAAGDLVLARVLGREGAVGQVPADFGVELTPATIDSALAAIRDGHVAYEAGNPSVVAAVRALAQ